MLHARNDACGSSTLKQGHSSFEYDCRVAVCVPGSEVPEYEAKTASIRVIYAAAEESDGNCCRAMVRGGNFALRTLQGIDLC